MNIVIVGAGGHGRVVLDIVRRAGTDQAVGFLDGDPALYGKRIDGLPVLGDISMLSDLPQKGLDGVIIAIGDNGIRRQYAETVPQAGLQLANAIHPSANLATNVTIGQNVVIAAGAMACAHCQIGNSAILNTGCVVDHESIIGNSAHICPGVKIAGRVIVESAAFVGIGAAVVQNIRIGRDAVVGAGAVVLSDVPAGVTVVGVPAKILAKRQANAVRLAPMIENELQAAGRF